MWITFVFAVKIDCGITPINLVNRWYHPPSNKQIVNGYYPESWKIKMYLMRLNEKEYSQEDREHRNIGFLIEFIGYKEFVKTFKCSELKSIKKDAALLWKKISKFETFIVQETPPVLIAQASQLKVKEINFISFRENNLYYKDKDIYSYFIPLLDVRSIDLLQKQNEYWAIFHSRFKRRLLSSYANVYHKILSINQQDASIEQLLNGDLPVDELRAFEEFLKNY